MSSPVILKMLAQQSNFTVSENEISQFVVRNADFVVTNTISALAKEIGISEASINRFCKKIGYQGYNSFKVALAQAQFQEELGNEPTHFSNEIEAISSDYRQLIVSASTMLDFTKLEAIAREIETAKTLYIVSELSTSFIAAELAYKLTIVGFNVHALSNITEIQLSLHNIQPEDLIIAIVPSLTSKDIYPFLVSAKDRRVKIVAITSNDSPKLNDIIDFKVVTPDSNVSKHPLVISNSMLYGFVMDVIYEILLKNNKLLRQKKLNSDTTINNQLQPNTYFYEY